MFFSCLVHVSNFLQVAPMFVVATFCLFVFLGTHAQQFQKLHKFCFVPAKGFILTGFAHIAKVLMARPDYIWSLERINNILILV